VPPSAYDKDETLRLLKSKAMLLMRREKELFELTQERDRVATWLGVFYALSEMLAVTEEAVLVSESSAMLIEHLGFEAVAIYRYEIGDETMTPVAIHPGSRAMAPIRITGGAQDPLLAAGSGARDETDAERCVRITQATGLEKYFWHSASVGEGVRYLLIAGFSPHAAAFHSLSDSDRGHFAMFGSHLAAQLRNAQLVGEVRRERQDLREANELLKAEMEERERVEAELRIAQKLEAVGQLAAGIAHEINTPIQYIGDNTAFLRSAFEAYAVVVECLQGVLAEAEATPEVRQYYVALDAVVKEADVDFLGEEVPDAIDQTLEGVDRVAAIVQAMREFARPGSKEKAPLDINRAVETTVTVSRNEWKYVADMETDLADNLPHVPALAGEINQVLLNLIVNAAHAIRDAADGSDHKGVIRITTGYDGTSVELRIADTGVGIPEEIQEHVFTPFFTTRDVGNGTGQGLAIARSVIVDKHDGTLEFESVPGAGSTFIVRLPLDDRRPDTTGLLRQKPEYIPVRNAKHS
jgi:signal transduction histidine kinase